MKETKMTTTFKDINASMYLVNEKLTKVSRNLLGHTRRFQRENVPSGKNDFISIQNLMTYKPLC